MAFHMADTHIIHISPRAYGLMSLSEKTRKSNHLEMLLNLRKIVGYNSTKVIKQVIATNTKT